LKKYKPNTRTQRSSTKIIIAVAAIAAIVAGIVIAAASDAI
jgi:hypothetical protein